MSEMTRKTWTEEEWNEFWYEFFNGEEVYEGECQDDVKMRHRENRRLNRMHKKHLVDCNKLVREALIDAKIRSEKLFGTPREDVEIKRYSLYRMRDNGKNSHPSKPVPRRSKNFFLKMISDPESYQNNFDDIIE